MKEWLEQLAEHMDDQAAAAKDVRAEVRRCAAQAEVEGGDEWYVEIGAGPVDARWRQATAEKGPLFRLSNSVWVKRRSAREARDAALGEIRADLIAAVEASLSHAAARATEKMMASLGKVEGGVGPWLAGQRDPRDARVVRERRAADAARTWLDIAPRSRASFRGPTEEGPSWVTWGSGSLGIGRRGRRQGSWRTCCAGARDGISAHGEGKGAVRSSEAIRHQQRGSRHDEADRHRVA